MKIRETTLAYIYQDHHYLMLFRNKKKNDINIGKWIGVGGHLENNETLDECIIREVKEETGLIVNSLNYRGKILFVSDDLEEIMHLYLINDISGDIKECNEGQLEWIKEENLLSLEMWEGDKIFLPLLIKTNEFIKIKLFYKKDKLVKCLPWE